MQRKLSFGRKNRTNIPVSSKANKGRLYSEPGWCSSHGWRLMCLWVFKTWWHRKAKAKPESCTTRVMALSAALDQLHVRMQIHTQPVEFNIFSVTCSCTAQLEVHLVRGTTLYDNALEESNANMSMSLGLKEGYMDLARCLMHARTWLPHG